MNKNNILKICVVIFFASYLIIGLLVYSDYGISTDEVVQRHHGLVSAKYITGFFSEELSEKLFPGITGIHEYEFKEYGVIFHLPLILLEKFINFQDTRNLWLFRHLCTFLFFYTGTIFFFLLAKQRFNSTLLGLLSVTILVISPRIFADSFYNIKDAVFLSAFIISVYFMIKAIENNKILNVILFSISAAFATNIRVIAIILPVLYPFFILMKKDIAILSKEKRDYVVKLFFCLLLYFFLVFAFWPASWSNPINLIWSEITLKSNYPWGGLIMYMGNQIKGMEVPWHYIPVWILITTPIFYTIFFLLGLGCKLKSFIKSLLNKKSIYSIMDNKSWQDLIFLAILFLPVLLAIILDSTLYNGWRHFYFIYPIFVIFVVSGLFSFYNYLSEHKILAFYYFKHIIIIIILSQILTTMNWMQKNHPHQNVYFSSAVNFFGQKKDFERDYWQLSIKQALEWLIKNKDGEINIIIYDLQYYSDHDTYSFKNQEYRSFILKESDKKRLKFYYDVNYMSENAYLINAYRYSVLHKIDYIELYSKTIDNLPIFTIYKKN